MLKLLRLVCIHMLYFLKEIYLKPWNTLSLEPEIASCTLHRNFCRVISGYSSTFPSAAVVDSKLTKRLLILREVRFLNNFELWTSQTDMILLKEDHTKLSVLGPHFPILMREDIPPPCLLWIRMREASCGTMWSWYSMKCGKQIENQG